MAIERSEPPSPESPSAARYKSLEDFVARTGVRRDELATLAEIGALNAFGFDRRSALWQIEKVDSAGGGVVHAALDRFNG